MKSLSLLKYSLGVILNKSSSLLTLSASPGWDRLTSLLKSGQFLSLRLVHREPISPLVLNV